MDQSFLHLFISLVEVGNSNHKKANALMYHYLLSEQIYCINVPCKKCKYSQDTHIYDVYDHYLSDGTEEEWDWPQIKNVL